MKTGNVLSCYLPVFLLFCLVFSLSLVASLKHGSYVCFAGFTLGIAAILM